MSNIWLDFGTPPPRLVNRENRFKPKSTAIDITNCIEKGEKIDKAFTETGTRALQVTTANDSEPSMPLTSFCESSALGTVLRSTSSIFGEMSQNRRCRVAVIAICCLIFANRLH